MKKIKLLKSQSFGNLQEKINKFLEKNEGEIDLISGVLTDSDDCWAFTIVYEINKLTLH